MEWNWWLEVQANGKRKVKKKINGSRANAEVKWRPWRLNLKNGKN